MGAGFSKNKSQPSDLGHLENRLASGFRLWVFLTPDP